MKMPDLSKQAMKEFFLKHAEKVVISVCALGLLAVAWLGLTLPVYKTEDPAKLSTRAVSTAGRFIESSDAWQQLEAHRKVTVDAADIVKKKFETAMDIAKYQTGGLLGPFVKLAEFRQQPTLVSPSLPNVQLFWSPVYMSPEGARPNTRMAMLKSAKGAMAGAANNPPGGGRGDEAPPDDLGSAGGGGDGRGQGAESGGRGGPAQAAGPAIPYSIPGEVMTPMQKQEWVGVSPNALKRGADAYMLPVVQVVSTLNLEEQKKAFLLALENTRAYYPERDQPDWYAVQIERQEEGKADWVDVTDMATSVQENTYSRRAPEILDPLVYSNRISRGLPPMVQFDYRQLASMARIPMRSLKPTDLFSEGSNEPEVEQQVNMFNSGNQTQSDAANKPKIPSIESYYGSRLDIYKEILAKAPAGADATVTTTVGSTQKVIRVFDLDPPKGKKCRYRVTAWLENPNNTASDLAEGKKFFSTHFKRNEVAGAADSGGGRGGGRGDGERAGPESGRGGESAADTPASTSDSGANADKSGPVLTDIRMADLDPAVRTVLFEKQGLRKTLLASTDPAMKKQIWKTYCLASTPVESDWIVVADQKIHGRVALGKSKEARMVRISAKEIPRDEPETEMAVSHWSSMLRTWVPAYRKDFRRGESTNFRAEFSHLLDMATLEVKRLDRKELAQDEVHPELVIRANQVLVDIAPSRIAGLKTPMALEYGEQKEPPELSLPGEILMMDLNGKFIVHNEYDDLRKFRNEMFLPDETNTYGKPSNRRPAVEAEGDDRGGRR